MSHDILKQYGEWGIKLKIEKNDYSRMKRKVFLQLVLMIAVSGIAVLLLYNFLKGKIGIWTIGLLSHIPRIDYNKAYGVYEAVFRNHWTEFMFLAMAVVFLILFHFSLTWFGRYFDSINKGINALLSQNHESITMPKEMRFVEENLQTVQRTLEQQRAEAELSEQKKDEIILYLAHDIKTPLTSVIGYLSILDENKEMDTIQREKCIRVSLDKAMRLEKLINEFFEITRFRQSDITLSKTKIDIHYLLIQLVDEFTPQLQTGHVKIEIDMPKDVYLHGDANYLARAFQNILKNAVVYSDTDSVIVISGTTSGENVVITVSNTGDTISPEQQTHIFEKFYRADEARQGNTGGAGLGLAIAKNIVMLHGGTIAVKSENRQTTFTIILPDTIM
ncbi:sensor histidine kinase [Dorea formicigenerans]|uniref:histidine kinase n=1 Tax=Dorea formicigenerans TaxID=39486 RepID=A0A3E4M019_9FIRM|nr:sensor histidine kinase [Dorea formicigenerans]